jgi:hypothetical protein
MTGQTSRRTTPTAGPAALASCGREGRYSGARTPGGRQELVYANGNEPDVFHPGTCAGGTEMRIINVATGPRLTGYPQDGAMAHSSPHAILCLRTRPVIPARGMQRPAGCERFLPAAMPLIPIYFEVYSSLMKPYVRGWESNELNAHDFKYVWADNYWRAS